MLQVVGHVRVDGKSQNLPLRHTSGRICSASFSRLLPVMLVTETVGISGRVAVNSVTPRISLPRTKLFLMSPFILPLNKQKHLEEEVFEEMQF